MQLLLIHRNDDDKLSIELELNSITGQCLDCKVKIDLFCVVTFISHLISFGYKIVN